MPICDHRITRVVIHIPAYPIWQALSFHFIIHIHKIRRYTMTTPCYRTISIHYNKAIHKHAHGNMCAHKRRGREFFGGGTLNGREAR